MICVIRAAPAVSHPQFLSAIASSHRRVWLCLASSGLLALTSPAFPMILRNRRVQKEVYQDDVAMV
jgi:hypothetical protein